MSGQAVELRVSSAPGVREKDSAGSEPETSPTF